MTNVEQKELATAAALTATKQLYQSHPNTDLQNPAVWAPYVLIGG